MLVYKIVLLFHESAQLDPVLGCGASNIVFNRIPSLKSIASLVLESSLGRGMISGRTCVVCCLLGEYDRILSSC